MKRLTLIVTILLLANGAVAQDDNKAGNPDYTRDNLLRLFKDAADEKPRGNPNIQFGVGFVDFKALGQRWRFNYLPIMIPLQGSMPWRSNDAWDSTPNPFALTGTTIPYTARTWQDRRAMNTEMKRIEKTERAKVKVKVEASSDQ